ncbi:hypothetical protein JXD38_05715, partial [candidate division WOR-3 bacterium]|nr:hypothetical protein [candidate division WOR-3 bacterium]
DGAPFFPGPVRVEIDGVTAGRRYGLPARLTFHATDKGWRTGPARAAAVTKNPGLYGPAKQAMMSPFLIAYGTRDSALTPLLRHSATQEGTRWWLIGNGRARVVPDTSVTSEDISRYNLVLYGGPQQNSVTRRIADHLPIRMKAGRLSLGTHDLGDSLAAMFVYPNPLNRDRLVLVRMGTDADATRLSLFWGLASSGAGIPDFMVFDRSVRRYAWSGTRAAGFFGPDWNIDPASMYLRK